MKILGLLLLTVLLFSFQPITENKIADPTTYLDNIKTELTKEWPKNRTINLVFHGHSVPAGYFKTPVVNTLASYPFQVLKAIKEIYPYAVVNVINTSIGGENSVSGERRFKKDVLIHKPDVLFIDYALNDRGIGLAKAKEAWEKMINAALKKNIKVILLTPSPDQSVNIVDTTSDLYRHAGQIKMLAEKYDIGLVDSYDLFRQRVVAGDSLSAYMSQINHPNERGDSLIAGGVMNYFK